MGATDIPALTNYDQGYLYGNSCGFIIDGVEEVGDPNKEILIFPDPTFSDLTILAPGPIRSLIVYSAMGHIIHSQKNIGLHILKIMLLSITTY